MKLRMSILLVLAVLISFPAFSQRGEERGGGAQHPANFPRANQGRIPQRPQSEMTDMPRLSRNVMRAADQTMFRT